MRRSARPLLYAGVLVIVFGLARVHAAAIGHYDFTGTSRFAWTVVYAGGLCVLAYGFGLPDLPRSRGTVLSSSVVAAWLGAVGMSVLQLFVGDALLPRFVVFGSALLLPDWYRICIRLSAGGRSRAEARDRVAVVAHPDEIAVLDSELQASPERPASLVARLTIIEAVDGTPLLDLDQPTVVVLDRAALASPAIVDQVAQLHARGTRVRTMTEFYDEWLGKLPMAELERAALLFDIAEVHRGRYERAKRVVDVPIAVAGCVALAVLVPVVAVANLVGNRGPLLYRQERVGKGGHLFTILKFRTMRPGSAIAADVADTSWTTHDDPRVTRFGKVLRASHLDELPQVVNILRGDLGVVGPRPEQPRYVEELTEKLPYYPLRHLVRPGLTGWAQVKYGYAGSESDALEKLQYEFWYLRHQSVATDAKIVGRTIRSVVGSEGRGR